MLRREIKREVQDILLNAMKRKGLGYCVTKQRCPAVPDWQFPFIIMLYAHANGRTAQLRRLRIVRQLRDQGPPASAERVRRSLQRQGLRPVYKRPYRVTTDSTHHLPVAPNLLDRRFDGWLPNQAWVSDTTILDLASRRIVGWAMSERITPTWSAQALRSACWQRKPAPRLLLHSDRGSQAGPTGNWQPTSR